MAHAAKDDSEILRILGHSLKMAMLWSLICLVVLGLLASTLAARLYGDSQIGRLATWLAVGQFADSLYNLIILVFIGQRAIQTLAVVQIINQAVLSTCLIAAAVLSPTPEALVAGQLIYSAVTMIMVLIVYRRRRTYGEIVYPSLTDIVRCALKISPRAYFRIGVANTIDKKLGNLMVELPLQLVGIVAGKSAVGLLKAALNIVTNLSALTSAAYDNLQAVIPQAIQRQDYAWVSRNFARVVAVLTVGSFAIYIPLGFVAPLLFPIFFGSEWRAAGPLVSILCILAILSTVGATITPVYRSFEMMNLISLTKIANFAVTLPVGILLVSQWGAVGGAWLLNLVYALWFLLAFLPTLLELRRRIHLQQLPGQPPMRI
jgi:O-antigen/teichoic acid export membrane protein